MLAGERGLSFQNGIPKVRVFGFPFIDSFERPSNVIGGRLFDRQAFVVFEERVLLLSDFLLLGFLGIFFGFTRHRRHNSKRIQSPLLLN